VGDYEKQGLIGRVDAQIKALANDILDLKTWKKKSEDTMKSLTWRIVGYSIAFIGILISAVVIYVQLNKGKI
jgi:ferredoxin-fold anticodon binding domain-containing protein